VISELHSELLFFGAQRLNLNSNIAPQIAGLLDNLAGEISLKSALSLRLREIVLHLTAYQIARKSSRRK